MKIDNYSPCNLS